MDWGGEQGTIKTRICPAGQKAASAVFSKDWLFAIHRPTLSSPLCFCFFFFDFSVFFSLTKKMWADFFRIIFFVEKNQTFRFLKSSIFFREFSTFFDFSTFSIFSIFDFFRPRKFFESKIFSDRKKNRVDKFSEHTFFQTPKILLPLFLTHSTHCTANMCPCREIRSSESNL